MGKLVRFSLLSQKGLEIPQVQDVAEGLQVQWWEDISGLKVGKRKLERQ